MRKKATSIPHKIIAKSFIIFSAACVVTLILSSFYYNHNFNFLLKEQDSFLDEQRSVTPIIINPHSIENLKNPKLRKLLQKINPFGFIFYNYNRGTYAQIKELNDELISLFPNRKLYIIVDQEGGLVDRLRDVAKEKDLVLLKKASYYGEIAKTNLVQAKKEIYQDSKTTARILKELNFDINLAPMLDLSDYEKDFRTYSADPKITYELGLSFVKGMQDEGIMVAPKHLPGIGRNKKDTHFSKKVYIDAAKKQLAQYDLAPFRKLAKRSEFGLVSHATYTKIDNKPATLSKKTIDFIKKETGFKGLLISDAFNMKTVASLDSYGENSINALEAGIDIIITNCTDHYCDAEVIKAIQETDHIEKFNEKLRKFEKERNLR